MRKNFNGPQTTRIRCISTESEINTVFHGSVDRHKLCLAILSSIIFHYSLSVLSVLDDETTTSWTRDDDLLTGDTENNVLLQVLLEYGVSNSEVACNWNTNRERKAIGD